MEHYVGHCLILVLGQLTMAEHNSSLAAGYKCFGNLPFGASQEKEKKKKKLPSSRPLNFTSQGQGDACLFEKDAGVYSRSNSPVFTIVIVMSHAWWARTPQAFLILMCLCIFRFIICPQAKVAASCPCPADVGRGVRSLSAFTYRAMCCVLNSLGAAQMVLLFLKQMALSFCRLFVFFFFLHGHQAHTGVSVHCVYSHV